MKRFTKPIHSMEVSFYLFFSGNSFFFGTFQFFHHFFFLFTKTDVSTWATSKVTKFEKMFKEAAAFNTDVSKWNLKAAVNMGNMFADSAFDRTICGDKWLSLNAFQSSNAGRHGCCNAGSYMSSPHATPFNAAESCAKCSDTNAVVSFRNNSDVACPTIQDMVDTWLTDQEAAITKYGSIENWDTSRVTDMSNLFKDAETFNADISKWNVSRVTSMKSMFLRASLFNGDVTAWTTSNVVTLESAFQSASVFNQDISKWLVSKGIMILLFFVVE